MNNYLKKFTEDLQMKGKYTFTLDEIRDTFPNGKEALRLALNRMSKKGKIVPVRKGFYVIVPPEYAGMGILPPVLFIDELMKFLKKPYYVSLYSAAALHGAAHQQPMEFYVTTTHPPNRDIYSRGVKINYFTKTALPETGISEIKTDTGWVKVSGTELTAYDLVFFQNKTGGLNRASTVIDELSGSMTKENLRQLNVNGFSAASLQRLGYLLDKVLLKYELAGEIFNVLQGKKIYPVPLNSAKLKTGHIVDPKWKVIMNETIETEL
ncbi:MAG: type IV toxin-antitoxin system AbiEi family antitoxin domain-containing protein [Bacteroidales bacterium]|nr:type IV toxin-antitoxin system AbiEi family antitoxin domain-containing protein [Bacteroidales bacterium]